jgi:hypothetical protein
VNIVKPNGPPEVWIQMILLDTDHLSILERDGDERQILRRRLSEVPTQHIAVSIISTKHEGK